MTTSFYFVATPDGHYDTTSQREQLQHVIANTFLELWLRKLSLNH